MDLVVPYVNCSDQIWQDQLRIHGKITITKNNIVRFRSWGTLRYMFRGVAKYMPFIDRIVLIVSGPSQVPTWINTNTVKVVYHKDFIPARHLPTFNSCTIEAFLPNIEDLSEKFIYANDDMFPIALCTEDDFFTEDLPNLKFVVHEKYDHKQMFRNQCRSGVDLMLSTLGMEPYEPGYIIRPYHITVPMLKSTLDKVRELCGPQIDASATMLRKERNINQYIYSYYHYFTDTYVNKILSYKYFELCDNSFNDVCATILAGEYQYVCLNDSTKLKDYGRTRGDLIAVFKRKFPDRCKFEG